MLQNFYTNRKEGCAIDIYDFKNWMFKFSRGRFVFACFIIL